MISPAFATTVLLAGAGLLLSLPAEAQSGSLKLPPRTTSPSDSAGTTSKVPGDNSSSTDTPSTTTGTVTTNSPATNAQGMTSGQGSASDSEGAANSQRSMQGTVESQIETGQRPSASPTWDDAPERQITECLNNAAAQRLPLDTCRR
jgi:hypothetical protein